MGQDGAAAGRRGDRPRRGPDLRCAAPPGRECGTQAGYRGGNDYTTFLSTGPGADAAAAAFIARVLAIAPTWWRITATAHEVWNA
jgi:hypothetical protein